MIRAIAILDDKRGLARGGVIPWHIPEDRRYFREQTENDTVVMGKVTYDEFVHPLANRHNVVVSHSEQSLRNGFELIVSIDDYLRSTVTDTWIIGGAETYASALSYCDELYITNVQGDFKCDKFFPDFMQQFRLRSQSEWQQENDVAYRFAVYERIEKPASP